MAEVQTLGFEESEHIKSNSFDKYKGEKGRDDIISIAWDIPKEMWRMAVGHYSNHLSASWLCLSSNGTQEICCTMDYDGSEPKTKMGCALVVYKHENQKITGVKGVMPWIIPVKTFEQLRAIYREHGHVDLVASCTDTKYQNFTFVPKKSCIWTQDEKNKASIKAKAAKVYERLGKFIYPKKSLSEIKELLGVAGGGDAANLDLGNIAGSLENS